MTTYVVVTNSSCRTTTQETESAYLVGHVQYSMPCSRRADMRISIGFSRGAYIARALAGKVRLVCIQQVALNSRCKVLTAERFSRSACYLKTMWSKFLSHTNTTSILALKTKDLGRSTKKLSAERSASISSAFGKSHWQRYA